MSKRIFISFAIEDANLRDLLVGQSKNDKCPFEFYDMSVKEPWDSEWKKKCRTKIKGCDGLIAIVTKNTKNASGQLWEISCAKEEKIPCKGIYGYSGDKPSSLPTELQGITVSEWKWDTIKKWINTL
jgi:hypothetical protein